MYEIGAVTSVRCTLVSNCPTVRPDSAFWLVSVNWVFSDVWLCSVCIDSWLVSADWLFSVRWSFLAVWLFSVRSLFSVIWLGWPLGRPVLVSWLGWPLGRPVSVSWLGAVEMMAGRSTIEATCLRLTTGAVCRRQRTISSSRSVTVKTICSGSIGGMSVGRGRM